MDELTHTLSSDAEFCQLRERLKCCTTEDELGDVVDTATDFAHLGIITWSHHESLVDLADEIALHWHCAEVQSHE